MDSGRRIGSGIEADKRVDFEVGEVEVCKQQLVSMLSLSWLKSTRRHTDVSAVHPDEEVNEDILLVCRDVGQEVCLDVFTGRQVCSDGDEKLECFGVDITDVYTSLVCEEDAVAISDRVDAHVEFGVRRMGKERLNDLWKEPSQQMFNDHI